MTSQMQSKYNELFTNITLIVTSNPINIENPVSKDISLIHDDKFPSIIIKTHRIFLYKYIPFFRCCLIYFAESKNDIIKICVPYIDIFEHTINSLYEPIHRLSPFRVNHNLIQHNHSNICTKL